MKMDKEKLIMFARRSFILFRRSFKMVWRSKPGKVGITIICLFSFMAVFAPVIAPYSIEFLAPAEDMFTISEVSNEYPESNNYLPVVVGPTTPSESNADGGMWIILANTNGTFYMDYTTKSITNDTPFQVNPVSITADMTDYGFSAPLTDILWVAPGRGYNSTSSFTTTFDDRVEAGLLAIVINETFVIFDPFEKQVLYQDAVGFTPTWFVEDVASSAELYDPPTQKKTTDIWFSYLEGPYRYVALADGNRIVEYEFEYCWNKDGIDDVSVIIDDEVNITQEPLIYVTPTSKWDDTFGTYVPSADGTLLFYSTETNGTPDKVYNFTVHNRPAEITAPLGYLRVTENPPRLFVPLAGDDFFSLKMLEPMNENITGEFHANVSARIDIPISPARSELIYVPVTYYSDGAAVNTTIFRLERSGAVDPTFRGEMDVAAVNIFNVEQASNVFALGRDGVVYAASTKITEDSPATIGGMSDFFSVGQTYSENPRIFFRYFGTFGGTKYGTLNSNEMYNIVFDYQANEVIMTQSIGTSLGALSPGSYPSGNNYILGTDNVGHDILTYLIYGSRVALLVGLTAAFFSVVVGTLIGLISGYYGGTVDTLLMRATDIALTLPFLPIVLIASQVMGQSIWNIVLILALLGWPGIARVVRAQTLSLKERSFIDAARASGAGDTKIILKHLMPNVLPFTFLYMTLFVAGAILTEAALSYLALGDPRAVSWGNMLSTIQTSGHSLIAPWWLLPPGLAITFLSLGFYLLGRAVDDIVNPRLRRR